jgi:hypothetical protein
VWLATQIGGGIDPIMYWDVEFFEACFKSAMNVYQEKIKAERKIPQYVELVEPKDPE